MKQQKSSIINVGVLAMKNGMQRHGMESLLLINLKILNIRVFLNIFGRKILKGKTIPSLLTEKTYPLLLRNNVITSSKEYSSQYNFILNKILPHCPLQADNQSQIKGQTKEIGAGGGFFLQEDTVYIQKVFQSLGICVEGICRKHARVDLRGIKTRLR